MPKAPRRTRAHRRQRLLLGGADWRQGRCLERKLGASALGLGLFGHHFTSGVMEPPTAASRASASARAAERTRACPVVSQAVSLKST